MVYTPVPRRPMTADEIRMGEALGFCRVLPATFDKRVIGELAACARDEAPAITEKQALLLRRLVHKYRRQLRDDVVVLAGARPPAPWLVTVPSDTPPVASPAPTRAIEAASPAQLSLL
jgi:hypothetical protein